MFTIRGVVAADLPAVVDIARHLDTVNLPGDEEQTRFEDLRTLSVPTLLLRGADAPLPTRRICQLLEQLLPHARGRVVDADPVGAISKGSTTSSEQ